MTTYIDICEDDSLYVCDKCKATFKAKEVQLKSIAHNYPNFDPLNPPLIVTTSGVVKTMSSPNEDGNLLACPKCGAIHLFGFDVVA